MAEPLVSVLVTAYQHGPYVRQCLESVLAQRTPFPVEVVVGEDGSTDGTLETCLALEAAHPSRIRVMQHGHVPKTRIRGRPTGRKNWELALATLRGRYFVPLDGDDYWTDPDKLRLQVEFLEQNPSYTFCFHDMRRIRVDGRELAPGPRTRRLDHHFEHLVERQVVPTVTVMFRRSALPDPMPPWMLTESPVVDYPMPLLASLHGPGRRIPRTMSVYRVGSGHWTRRREIDVLRDAVLQREILVREFPEERRPLLRRHLERERLVLAQVLAREGELDEARRVRAAVRTEDLSLPRDLTRLLPAGLALQGPTWARVAWGARAAVERAREEAWARVGSRGR